MFSFRALTSIPIKPRKRKKQVFKLPQEVTNLKFYPLDEKKQHSVNGDLEEDNIQEAINEVLSHNYKNRSLDFIDESEPESSENQQSVRINAKEQVNEPIPTPNISEDIPPREQQALSISNLMVFDSAPVDEIETNQTNEVISTPNTKSNQKKKIHDKKKSTQTVESSPTQTSETINQSQVRIQQSSKPIIGNIELNAALTNRTENVENVTEENKENPFRREAHCFCTFPKRKPNPVTPEMKKLIARQRIFEHKPNYYPEALTSSSDSEDIDFNSFHIHHDIHNNFDWNHHRRACKSDYDDENDPRFYKPEIPELTRNPRSVSSKLCQSILRKKPKSNNKQSLTPKRPKEQFNCNNVYVPPEKIDVSIFYPKKEITNLESEESFLLHPDKPLPSPVRKCNNSLFKSNIHFCDFDSDHRSNSVASEVQSQSDQIKNDDIEEASDENDYNEAATDNSAPNDHRHDLNYARRFPEKYLQSLAEEN